MSTYNCRGAINGIIVQNNPVNWIDPEGLWSFSLEGYYGVGGGVKFGKDPGGGYFFTLRYGHGIGGGFSFDPKGSSPKNDPCDKRGIENVSIGGFAELGIGLGPLSFGSSIEGGLKVENGEPKPYVKFSPPDYKLNWNNKWRFRGGYALGREITFY